MTIRGSIKLIFNSEVYFIQNHANNTGGAIYVDDPMTCLDFSANPCFFLVNASIENVLLVFFDNDTAGIAGNVLFGGQLEGCEYSLTVGSLNCRRNIRTVF